MNLICNEILSDSEYIYELNEGLVRIGATGQIATNATRADAQKAFIRYFVDVAYELCREIAYFPITTDKSKLLFMRLECMLVEIHFATEVIGFCDIFENTRHEWEIFKKSVATTTP